MRRATLRSFGRIALLLAVTPLLLVAPSTDPAEATDRGVVGVMSPTNTVIERTITPGLVAYPGSCKGQPDCPRTNRPYLPSTCQRDVPHCDRFRFGVNVPPDYPELYGILITVSWPEGTRTDIDLYVWSGNWTLFGTGDGCEFCSESTTKNPEAVTLGEPGTGTCPDGVAPCYYVTVINHRGSNASYKIRFEWTILDIGDGNYSRPSRRQPQDSSGSQASITPRQTAPNDVNAEEAPEPTLSPMKAPGPDGELTEQALPILVSGRGDAAPEQGIGPMLITMITVLVMGAVGLGTFFVLRRRRRAIEA